MYRKAALLLIAVLLYGCAGSSTVPAEIAIEETEFGYSPSSMTVVVRQPVTLTIHNAGSTEHDFVIQKINASDVVEEGSASTEHSMHDMQGLEDYDLHVSTREGETSILKFTPQEAGMYQVFCSVPGHKELGMLAELIVVEE